MRPAKACLECRATKRRCVRLDNDKSRDDCLGCRSRQIRCTRSLTRQRSQNTMPLIAPVSTSYNGLPSDEDSRECVGLYLQFIHERPHSIFHEKTLWQDLSSGELSRSLLLAICALGCRFSTRHNLRVLSTAYQVQSSTIFATQLEQISLSNIQTAILLANIYAAGERNDLEALYFGIANRMAYVLRLHQRPTTDPPVLRETKCRIWWSLFMADRWCPPGLGLPREIPGSRISLDLPMEEVAFQEMDTKIKIDPKSRKYGLWHQNILLVDVLGPIQDLNVSMVNEDDSKNEIDEKVANLAGRLQEWHDSLPSYMKMSQRNLDAYRSRGLGGTFVGVHLGYHHYSTLLYFHQLDAAIEPSTDSGILAQECRWHAMAFSNLLYNARQKDDCHVVYITVAYMTMVSSSVLLHMLLFGTEDEIELARAGLLTNFEALLELKKYWSCMNTITSRLLIFQHTCLQLKTFIVDRWLLRFLLEYGLPFSRKTATNDLHAVDDNAALLDTRAPLQQPTSLARLFEELRY